MQLTGAEIIIECLKEQKVDTVFGYPGGAILNVYDALYKHSNEIHHVLTSHEQGASHAADGYARATGKVGVCLATSGPGATNLVTGIATAYMDSVPVVAITANVGKPLLGRTVHHTFLLVMYHRLTTASTETAVTIPEPELISGDHCEREILWLYITEFTVFIKTIARQQSSVQIRNQVKTFFVNREKINIIFI